MNSRLFIALPVTDNLKLLISKFEADFTGSPVHWIFNDNLHITLVPPWYEKNPADIIRQLQNVKVSPGLIRINFTDISLGPDPNRPKLIWAKARTPPELRSLKSEIEKTIGFRPDKREFLTHLTLARFRASFAFPLIYLNDYIQWPNEINSFILMQSVLNPDGVKYVRLAEFFLG
jgi:2'-5' RNA ligase